MRSVLSVAVLCASVLTLPYASAHAGTINGKVLFDGDPPARRTIKMAADPVCETANPNGRLGEAMVIGEDKAIANVFVYVKEGLAGGSFETPKEPAVMDQKGCMYAPRVFGVMPGQTIEIVNSDTTLHNVHALPKQSRQFNNAMPMKGMKIKKRFTSPEVMVRVKCDVHPWMTAWVGVLEHPFHSVTGSDGTYTISGLAAGTYTVEAWHERLGTKTESVTVSENAAAAADFSFAPAKK